jgi:hypothetical protein
VVWRLENAEFQSRGLEPDSVAQKAVDCLPILGSSIVLDIVIDFLRPATAKIQIENDNEHEYEDD